MNNQLLEIVVNTTRQIVAEQGLDAGVNIDAQTRLFGDGGLLDSMALVSLVIAVEQAIEEQFGKNVGLADEKALSQRNSPYRSVASLVEYAARELQAPQS